jgi:hypothetical protein
MFHRPAIRGAVVYLACLLATVAMYHGTNITFLRADSGYFQMLAHESPKKQKRTIRHFWHDSVDGHYTPLAFIAELRFTRFAGTRASVWRWRQMLVVAAIIAALYIVATYALRTGGFTAGNARACGAGIAAIVLAHPLMTDFVAWPFHVVQLEWMFMNTLTLGLLLKGAVSLDQRPFWICVAAASGYASMHALGLGFVTAVGTASVLSVLLLLAYSGKGFAGAAHRRRLGITLLLLSILTTAHALAMLFLVVPHDVPASSFRFTFAHGFGLLGLYPIFALLSLPGIVIEPTLTAEVIRSGWPFGVALLGGVGICLWAAMQRLRTNRDIASSARAVLLFFSSAAFLMAIFLIGARQWKLPSDLGLYGYVTGPRYLGAVSFTLFGAGLWCLTGFSQTRQRSIAVLCIAVGLATCLAQRGYQEGILLRDGARSRISHEDAWQLILRSAREARLANLPVPNVPLGQLTQEFYAFDLKLFAPLLRAELGLRHDERCEFVDWQSCRTTLRAEYDRDVPSLKELIAMLHLE